MPDEAAKNAQKSKIVAFLLFNVKNNYYFCTRKIVENIKLTQIKWQKNKIKVPAQPSKR